MTGILPSLCFGSPGGALLGLAAHGLSQAAVRASARAAGLGEGLAEGGFTSELIHVANGRPRALATCRPEAPLSAFPPALRAGPLTPLQLAAIGTGKKEGEKEWARRK